MIAAVLVDNCAMALELCLVAYLAAWWGILRPRDTCTAAITNKIKKQSRLSGREPNLIFRVRCLILELHGVLVGTFPNRESTVSYK